ncbi:MAG: hypothetical protein ACRDKF_16500 [Actinomycetota bacterium]
MGQTPYWMQQSGEPPPPPPEPPKGSRSLGVKLAVGLLAVALIAVSAFAYAGWQRTNDLEDRLDEQTQPQPEGSEDPANPLDDLLGDLGGGGGDLFGGTNTDLLECLTGVASGPGGLFGGGEGLGDLFGGGGSSDESASPAKLVKTISKQVEKVRKLRFEKPVDADFLLPRELQRRVGELFLEDYSKRDASLEARVLGTLGAIPRHTDLFSTRKSLLEGQVAGFYVPETEELVVLSGKTVGPLEKTTLAHELEHALADQKLGLGVDEESDPKTADKDLARLAVVEGDATLTMQRWALAHLSLGDQLGMLGGSPQLQESQEQLESMPHYLRQELSFPYLDGMNLVCDRYKRGGWAAVDKAYDAPPASTDQVLFPERYDPKAEPVDPRDPGTLSEPWSRELSGSIGAAELKWLFEAPGGDTSKALADPLKAVAAWAGGDVDLWTDGDQSALGISLVQRAVATDLCDSVTQWYSASFDDDNESREGGAALVAEGGVQDAVITCSGDEVRIGIGPDTGVARSLVD